MGYRDDASFVQTNSGFEVAYTLDGERVLELRLEGDQFWWQQWWHGLDGGIGAAPADRLGFLVQDLPLFDSWQDEIERELHALGNFGWARQRFEDLRIAALPDGIFVEVVFPLDGSALVDIARFYQQLYAEPTSSPRPVAYALFTSLPVTHRWSPQAEAEAPSGWAWRFWQAYSSELGLEQPFPGQPTTTDDGGTAITIAREGFLHIVTLPLRDLLPFAALLVDHGLVADQRFEDAPYEKPGWERTTAPFRAMAATVGSAAEQELAFSDEDDTITCMYPTATAARIQFDATSGRAFEVVDFQRVLELTEQYSTLITNLDTRIRALTDQFKKDPEGAAKRHQRDLRD
jgi:hypothetical protein